MQRFILTCVLVLSTAVALAQGSVKGHVLDKKSDESLEFVNVAVYQQGDTTKILKGAITDEGGNFRIGGLANGRYVLVLSYIGYKNLRRNFTISSQHREEHFASLYMAEDSRMLKEVTVTGQRASVKLEVDRKTFDVSQDIANAGGAASDVLENIPSVEVDQDGNVSALALGTATITAKTKSGVRYNLMGQPVDENYKGIVIQDGKKFIQK